MQREQQWSLAERIASGEAGAAPPRKSGGCAGYFKRVARGQAMIAVKEAAELANKSPDSIVRLSGRHGIGSQLHKHAPWKIDPLGLCIVIAGDPMALEAYQAGELDNPAAAQYLPLVDEIAQEAAKLREARTVKPRNTDDEDYRPSYNPEFLKRVRGQR